MGVELVGARAAGGRGRLPHHPPPADQGDRRPGRQGAAGPGQARRCGSSTWPGAASWTRTRWPGPIREGVIAGAALDVFASRADHRVAAVRAGQRGRHPPPRRQHPRGAGQGRRDHRRDGAAGPGRRVRALRRQRRAPPRPPRRCGRSCALAERLGRLFTSLAEGVPATVEVCYEGQLADYDTRILTLAALKGLFGGVSEDPVTYVNAPTTGQGARRRDPRGQLQHRRSTTST